MSNDDDHFKSLIKNKIDYKDQNLLKDLVTKKVLDMIKEDLSNLGIIFDLYSSEKVIHEKGLLDKVLDILNKKKLSKYFTEYHMLQMVAAIWSMPFDKAKEMPLKFFLDFLQQDQINFASSTFRQHLLTELPDKSNKLISNKCLCLTKVHTYFILKYLSTTGGKM